MKPDRKTEHFFKEKGIKAAIIGARILLTSLTGAASASAVEIYKAYTGQSNAYAVSCRSGLRVDGILNQRITLTVTDERNPADILINQFPITQTRTGETVVLRWTPREHNIVRQNGDLAYAVRMRIAEQPDSSFRAEAKCGNRAVVDFREVEVP